MRYRGEADRLHTMAMIAAVFFSIRILVAWWRMFSMNIHAGGMRMPGMRKPREGKRHKNENGQKKAHLHP